MRALKLSLRLGAGEDRAGSLLLVLPVGDRAAMQTAPDGVDDGWRTRLADAVTAASVPVAAVLARLTLSLKDMDALRPGLVLPLPPDAVARVSLESAPCRILMRGQLGRARGMRALRLSDPVTGDVPDPVWRTRAMPPPLGGLVAERPVPPAPAAVAPDGDNAAPLNDRFKRAAG
jgi:flagellar motor switch protein FliM